MTERELFEAIGHLDDDLILAADAPVKKRRRPPVYWRGFAAAAACACIFLGGVTVWQRSAIPHDAVMLSDQLPETAAAEAAPDEALADTAAPQIAGNAEANEGAAGSPILPPPAQGCVEVNGSDKFAVFAVGIQFHRLHPPEYRCAGHNNIQIVNAVFRIITEHIAAGFDL